MNKEPIVAQKQDLIPTSASSYPIMHSNFRRWSLVALSGLILSGLAVLPRFMNTAPEQSRRSDRILPVRTTQVKAVKSYSVTRAYTGEVAAARISELGFERAGKLVRLNVDVGDRIVTGTQIAKLDTQNLLAQRQQILAQKAQAVAVLQELQNGPRTEVIAAARATVGDLKYQLELEQIKRDRREQLYKQGAISKEQLDEVTFNQNALSDRYSGSQSRLNELETGTRKEQIAAQQAVVRQLEASIADMEITIAKSTITAPFSGTIGERRLDEGTVVNAGQSVVRLVEEVSPEVEIGVPAEVASRLKPGSEQQVEIAQKNYRATVVSLKPEVNPTTRTRTVILSLESSALQSVAPKQIARLAVKQTVPTNGYWLPITALVRGERGLWSCYALNSVSLQDKSYRVERQDVEVLHTEGNRVLVRGTLQPKEHVVIDGTHGLVPGQLVQLN